MVMPVPIPTHLVPWAQIQIQARQASMGASMQPIPMIGTQLQQPLEKMLMSNSSFLLVPILIFIWLTQPATNTITIGLNTAIRLKKFQRQEHHSLGSHRLFTSMFEHTAVMDSTLYEHGPTTHHRVQI